ncbi:MAG: hypothetical protein ACI9SK_001911 [Zhongshania sp.]|jgi:hypothetical protein
MTLTAKYLPIFFSALLIGCATTKLPSLAVSDVPTIDDSLVDPAANCDISSAIRWMESQKIIYTQQPTNEWRDCSGNFLRLSSRIAEKCPGVKMAAPAGIRKFTLNGDNAAPGEPEARTTRELAKWYDDRKLFTPVFYDEDAFAAPANLTQFRNKIKPGTVFWFSRKIPKFEDGKTSLYKQPGGAIGHMGTVVKVEKDNNGNVVGWTMYHGQNSRKHNGTTSHKWAESGIRQRVPQGGYGTQRIVGFAPYLIPSNVP